MGNGVLIKENDYHINWLRCTHGVCTSMLEGSSSFASHPFPSLLSLPTSVLVPAGLRWYVGGDAVFSAASASAAYERAPLNYLESLNLATVAATQLVLLYFAAKEVSSRKDNPCALSGTNVAVLQTDNGSDIGFALTLVIAVACVGTIATLISAMLPPKLNCCWRKYLLRNAETYATRNMKVKRSSHTSSSSDVPPPSPSSLYRNPVLRKEFGPGETGSKAHCPRGKAQQDYVSPIFNPGGTDHKHSPPLLPQESPPMPPAITVPEEARYPGRSRSLSTSASNSNDGLRPRRRGSSTAVSLPPPEEAMEVWKGNPMSVMESKE